MRVHKLYPYFFTFQDTQHVLDLLKLGPYNLCLTDGRMRSTSYTITADGMWLTNVQYFEKNSIENICREDEEWNE